MARRRPRGRSPRRPDRVARRHAERVGGAGTEGQRPGAEDQLAAGQALHWTAGSQADESLGGGAQSGAVPRGLERELDLDLDLFGEAPQQRAADAAVLPLVEDRDRRLGHVWLGLQPHVTGAPDAVAGVRGPRAERLVVELLLLWLDRPDQHGGAVA